LAIAAWVKARDLRVLIGALLLGAVIPFTLLVIRSTNARLLDPVLDPSSPEAALLLNRWGWLHAIRSVAGGLAFGLLLCHLAQRG
jgi:anthrone oxygenase-like protein